MVALIARRNKQLSGGHAVYTLDNKEIRVDKSDKAKKQQGEMSCSI